MHDTEQRRTMPFENIIAQDKQEAKDEHMGKKEPKKPFNPIGDLIGGIRYKLQCLRIGMMDEKAQRNIGKEIYSVAYQSIAEAKGDVYAACAVVFECPYDGHVAYHVEQTMDKRVNNPADATEYYDLRKMDDGKWVISVIAGGTNKDVAMSIADACAMSAVLNAPTSEGSFQRYVIPLEEYSKDSAAKFVDEHVMPLLAEHEVAAETVEI